MDNDNITIYENDLESARFVCSSISDTQVRNRAVANVVAAEIASRYFDNENYDIDTETGLHNINSILEEVDISDIYVNGSYVDVRVYFNDDEICVPKSHYDMGIIPAVYMFIKLSQDLSHGVVTGFIRPEFVETENSEDGNCFISENTMVSFYDIESRLENVLDMYEGSNAKLYELLEGSLDTSDKIQLIKDLIASKSARTSLLKIAKAQSAFNFVSINQEQSEYSDEESAKDNEILSELTEADLDDLFTAENEFATEVTPSNADIIAESKLPEDETLQNNNINAIYEQQVDSGSPAEQIDNLFTGEQEGIPVSAKKKSSGLFTVGLIFLLILAGGYFWYTNTSNNSSDENLLGGNPLMNIENETKVENIVDVPQKDAMPNENVEAVSGSTSNAEQGISVEIPAIEQHLDASVLVSNLKIDWEVPAGYASNTSAKRYFVKIGKVIQLNLKTELLLLNKPPIANKISVELKFNNNIGKFEVAGIVDSSGEKIVDDVILQTIKNALSMSISSNIDSFGKLQGNPVLIIHL